MSHHEHDLAPDAEGAGTRDAAYKERLITLQSVWWKRLLPVQAPYRYNVRRLRLGRTLDIGCGIGRLLVSLPSGSIGVDHNRDCVAEVKRLGLTAYTTDDFADAPEAKPESFDSILLAHVIEHVDDSTADEILQTYLPYVRPGGSVHFITPQEWGYASDPTHIRFANFDVLSGVAKSNSLTVVRSFSYPFPRRMGKIFKYNEFNVLARKP